MQLWRLLMLLWLSQTNSEFEKRDQEQASQLPKRLHQLMVNYRDRGVQKINEITPIRGKYEESPHFELGYVMSEILERYRRMVGQVKRPMEIRADTVFDTIKYSEIIQTLFIEIFHLVNMLHEIPRKYAHMREFQEQIPYDRTHVENVSYTIEENKRIRERQKKKRLKELKKERELFAKGEISVITQRPRKPRNKWWPIDYGWEIDYYW